MIFPANLPQAPVPVQAIVEILVGALVIGFCIGFLGHQLYAERQARLRSGSMSRHPAGRAVAPSAGPEDEDLGDGLLDDFAAAWADPAPGERLTWDRPLRLDPEVRGLRPEDPR